MKVLHVIPFFSQKLGGIVNSCYLLSKKMAMKGNDVTIITTDYELDRAYIRSIEEYGVKVIPFHCNIEVSAFLVSRPMEKWLDMNIRNYDIVHMHSFRTHQNVIARKYAKKYGVPYVVQPRGDVPILDEKASLKQLFDIVWGKKILIDASRVLAFTNIERSDCVSMGVKESNIEVTPNGIEQPSYRLPEKGAFRKRYGIKTDEKIILFLGRIHKIKGVDLLIDAYNEVLKESTDARLVIVGPDGGFLVDAKKQIDTLKINEKVLITGPLYDINKFEAYTDADVYVLPSNYEAFANTILESWLCGTPVVVTEQCAIADIVQNAGLVVKYDKNQLKNAILQIFNDYELKEKITHQGLIICKENFMLDSIVSRIEKTYASLIKN